MLNLLFPFLLVSFASADYHIGFIVQSIEFPAPNNTLADGSCCDSSCGADGGECCDNGCLPSMRLCFREPQHPSDDPSCPLLEVLRNTAQAGLIVRGTDNTPIDKYYTGGFQLYIRIAHTVGDAADFDPPFDDPLIDEFFLEFTVAPVLFSERLTSPIRQVLSTNETFGRVEVTIAAFAHCANGWNGSACEIQCISNVCTQETFITTTTPESTLPQSPTTEGVISTEGSNVVAIAVGVSVGVVVLIIIVLVVIPVVAAIKKKMTWNQSFNPSTVSYTLKAKRNIKGVQVSQGGNEQPPTSSSSGGQAVNGNNKEPVSHYSSEPHTGQAVAATAPVYAAVNMERKGKKLMEESGEYSEPPSVPPYTPSDMDSYAPMKEQNGVVYENLNK